jgi:ABC-type sugar transport system ATPase subunit
MDRLRIVAPSARTEVRSLSGGNQQKCVLARLLAAKSDVLLLDEPTRGIDVGAKAEVYGLMNKMADSGKAILMISSDLPEVLGMSDRVVVFRRGRVAVTLTRDEATETKVMRAAVPSSLRE